ncbi:MAG: sugar ABC transporter substrate-binding protein, partial [Terrabacter sp.]|nr:sugar ABC transporter substrate-binding protein [Terrabacter sp.]
MTSTRARKGLPVAAAIAALSISLAACSGGGAQKTEDTAGGGGGAGDNSGYTFAMVTHE